MTQNNDILNAVLPRIIQPSSTDVSEMGLEIMDGPYKGVTFGYTAFESVGEAQDGMQPVRYDTTIYSAPAGFVKDEGFDAFTSEFLVAWIGLIADSGKQ